MHNKIRKNIQVLLEREHLKESMKEAQKKKLVSILNNLEFKDDIINADGEIYAVGGIVRDAIMNEPSDDLDIVVRGIPYDELYSILSKYGKATDTSHEKEEGDKDFGSTKFVSNNEDFNEYLKDNGVARDIDVMLPRKDAKDPSIKGHKGIKSDVNPMYSIEDDLGRRDITINAIAMDLSGNLISKGTGLDDIKSSPDNNGVIKAVSEDAFVEDPLRMLRAVRFNARYNIVSKQDHIAPSYGETSTPSYETFDVRLGVKPIKNVTIGLAALNVFDKIENNGFATRTTGSFSLNSSTQICGLVPIPFGPVKSIRHVMSPTIGYSWTPDFSEDFLGKDLRYVRRRSIENNEEKIFDRFSGTIAGNTPKSEQKSMTFGINNIFQAKVLKAEEEKSFFTRF
mgnify:CR=1 FL=1